MTRNSANENRASRQRACEMSDRPGFMDSLDSNWPLVNPNPGPPSRPLSPPQQANSISKVLENQLLSCAAKPKPLNSYFMKRSVRSILPCSPIAIGSLLMMCALLGLAYHAHAQLDANRLTFELLPADGADEAAVQLQWAGEPDLVLQRSRSLDRWETLLGTRGQDSYTAPQEDATIFYRLVELPDESTPGTTLKDLEWRLTEMTINQIQRAVDPLAAREDRLGPTPPDDESEADLLPGISLFGILEPYAWASQPGLIRFYSPDQQGFSAAFKLYSSADSVATDPAELEADQERIRAWKQAPLRFTDLNAPQTAEDGSVSFPILDPRASSLQVEGFAYPEDTVLGTKPNESLPMPAEWLYVLQDGSLGTLNAKNRWQGEGTPSEANPMVARVAYWADDETSKLNVNVASEGVPWDVPRADTPVERDYALNQPVRGEIHRYPGHPSMTSLSSLLFPGKAANHPDESKRLTDGELEQIFALTPRAVRRVPTPGLESDDVLAFDETPLHSAADDWIQASRAQGISTPDYLKGFVSTNNPSPEISIHGAPRISMWPLPEQNDSQSRSDYDRASSTLTEFGRVHYAFQRRDPTSRHGELYVRAGRHNINLFKMLGDQTYQDVPGYGASLAEKYGARLQEADYRDNRDYDKDHYAIALSMFDRLRSTNVLDPNVDDPYANNMPASNVGFGMVSPLNLIGRNLDADNGAAQHGASHHKATLEPTSAGRSYTLSELALVAYVTSEVTIDRWSADNNEPVFSTASGPGGDVQVMERILSNEHPEYAKWLGRRFGVADVGKTFQFVEVGLVPELFSPAQGYPRKAPKLSLRLLTSGQAYRGGFNEDLGLKINGVPLQLWGEAIEESPSTALGPLVASTDILGDSARNDLPLDWRATGGPGGSRLFRFGRFTIDATQPGHYGSQFLANGSGPLANWYCQSPVIVEKGRDLKITQEAPITIALYDQATSATTGNLVRYFNLRFAPPGEALEVPGPGRNSGSYAGWTRRFRQAANSTAGRPVQLMEPQGTEAVKGLSISHGDYRHMTLKRIVPSELLTHHPLAEKSRASHSLTWATEGGTGIESTATQGPGAISRSLVAGVDYAPDALPDFTHDPRNRSRFAPLLGENYHFPIDPTITRDFDNGLGNVADGAYINTPDDGESEVPGHSLFNVKYPYFELEPIGEFKFAGVSKEHHFARRMAPSPVAFGSIPSASQANAPWTCLLFRPNLADPSVFPHLGEAGNGMLWERNRTTLESLEVPQMASVVADPRFPADHLWLDLFWMPTAEPNHTASPFATQGKVNMNYQMFPYTYIERATAMHAVLKGEEVLAIPTEAGPTYKTSEDNPNWRHRIDAKETLKQFAERFARGEIFMTESEICEQFLIPEGETWDANGNSIRAFWDRHRLSGDNTLERPYAGLYSRLTTRSNAFRLHYRIQIVDKDPAVAADLFEPTKDQIVEDKQGAKVIERILDNSTRAANIFAEGRFKRRPRLEQFYDVVVHDVD